MLEVILGVVDGLCQPGDAVSDLFAGTLSVSLSLKQRGYRVISNDINKFSYVFGRAFLTTATIPCFCGLGLPAAQPQLGELFIADAPGPGYAYLRQPALRQPVAGLRAALAYLNALPSAPDPNRRNDFYDHYTEAGRYSQFRSVRGQEGRRRFFSPANGAKMDAILHTLRAWRTAGQVGEEAYYLLLSCLLTAVERVSNTQGTYHDFPRDTMDSRALKPLLLRLPPLDVALSSDLPQVLGRERDSLEFVREIPPHRLLYLDPPYNFRQYTAYYFMLNLISDYCDIADPATYFADIQFVRGQNMSSDFTSSFCKANLFIPSLEQLISDAPTEYVVMSYYDGRNHLNGRTPQEEHLGLRRIEALFQGALFQPGSFEVVPIKRLNYQSYGGHQAKELNEYLFIGKKR